jgi:hypothetical protein
MKKNAAFRERFNPQLHTFPVALLVVTALFLAGIGGAASAAPPIGKDGKIHACYRVKGKPKGSLRVVPGNRCKRGERKVVWSIAGSSGQGGANGQAETTGGGQQGQSGSSGTNGSNEAILKSEIAGLELKVAALEGLLQGVGKGDLNGLLGRVDGLEGVLDGVTNSDLTGALDTLEGVTNTELLDTVASLPALDLVCEQSEELAEQANLLRGVIGGLDLEGVLGGLLKIPTLPGALNLNEFGCSAP